MPFAPHPVEHDSIFFIEIQLGKFYYGYVLVRAVRTVPVGKHKSPTRLENCIVCDGVGPVMIACKKDPGCLYIPVCKRDCISNFLPVYGKFFYESFPFKISNHRRFR